MKEKDVPVGEKIILTVKSLDMDDTVEIIRVECVEDEDQNRCSDCAFRHREECRIYECFSVYRKDGKDAYFKKIEVVNEELNLNNKNMSREFNLEAALNGAEIRTRCGYPARIIATNLRGNLPIAVVVSEGEIDFALLYDLNGRRHKNVESNYDLVMAPEKRYINIFQDKNGSYHCSKKSYQTEEMAKELEGFVLRKYKGCRYVETVEIEEY